MLSSILLFLSGQDTIVILIVALVLFGGKKLPELARGLGQGIREFKDASEGVKRDIQDQINKETTRTETPAAPPVQTTTLIPDHSTPVTNTPGTPVNSTALIPDHSAPVAHPAETPVQNTDAEATTINHPRETPL